MKYLLLAIASISLGSCATILSKDYSVTRIQTFPQGAKIIVNQKDTICCSERDVVLKKEKGPVEITFIKDTLRKTIVVDPKLSTTYFLGNLVTPYLIGYFIDLTNNKRLTFPKEIYVDIRQPNARYSTFILNDQHPLNLTLGMPLYNDYIFQGFQGRVNRGGALGGSIGLEYYVSPKAYISTQMSSLVNSQNSDNWFGYYDEFYNKESRNTFFINYRYNRIFQRLHVGLGLAYQHLQYSKTQSRLDSLGMYNYTLTDKSNNKQVAASMSAHFALTPTWFVGCVYQPILYDFKSVFPKYQHYFNIELIYKIHLMNTRPK
jgi:hypothetical protein